VNDPTHRRLIGDLRSQARHGELIAVLRAPQTKPEADLLEVLARWLSDDELKTLIALIKETKQS
jgi:hypothetical protein